MKRKAQQDHHPPIKKRTRVPLSDAEVRSRFRAGLLDPSVLAGHAARYAESGPFRHGVIDQLVDDTLLRQVRSEIRSSVSFAPKETDIYKIHQSGDLANLDGLDDSELRRLPALLRLRDALYSDAFRAYVSAITGCGPLSGTKTDMAVNVYTPGCFLLCHDDVIGSRRVSYILYLTDPDEPWKPEWGGALRLYGTEQRGKAKTPTPDPVRIIAPAWNQLSFFAVQPGESFHDVEEVYEPEEEEEVGGRKGTGTGTGKGTAENKTEEGGARRVRMAISGWFHLPQAGEDGFVRGAVEELMVNSSLAQLSGNPDQYDLPQPRPVRVTAPPGQDFDEADLEFLLKYINPTYLTPGTIEGISEHFDMSSTIILPAILCEKFAARLRRFVTEQEAQPIRPGMTTAEIEKATAWRVARPPHKHHFLYQQPAGPDQLRASRDESPLTELLDVLMPSRQFRKWLHFATGFNIVSHDILARRFRRGSDYTLATGHAGKPHLEINLGFTPTRGWGDDGDGEEEGDEEEEVVGEEEEEGVEEGVEEEEGEGEGEEEGEEENEEGEENEGAASGETGPGDDDDKDASGAGGLTGKTERTKKRTGAAPSCDDVGGLEVYMADDEDDQAHDAAVYRPTSGPDGDDGNVLFFQPAAWNKMTMVLRDRGSLRFVKYVSRRARGDRWDISAVIGIVDPTESGEEDGGDGQERSGKAQQQQRQQSAEEDAKSKSTDTDSD